MIYYFSGTGNTRRLATLLARQLDTEAIDIRQWLLSVEPLPLSFAVDTSVGFAFPVYGWDRNKGYPTPAHRQAIEKMGHSPLQRFTFMETKPSRKD